MKELEVHIHVSATGQPTTIKIGEDASIAELLKEMQAAGAAIGESGEKLTLWIEDKEVECHEHQRVHECGIRHGHHLHCHPKEVVIIVNTREKKWNKREISYREVVIVAFGSYSDDPNVVYTVTYSKGLEHKRQGSLVIGQSVNVKNGMIFNVSQTNKS